MNIRCPNRECNVKMSVPNHVKPNSKAICPACKKMFVPYDVIYADAIGNRNEITGQNIQNNQKTSSETIMHKGELLGWLIVHDEKAPSQTLDIYEGLNLIGRQSDNYMPLKENNHYLSITTNDLFMSREHFFINAKEINGMPQFLLKDAQSKNCTYIDSKRLAANEREMIQLGTNDEYFIEDGSVILAGKTKIHFKSKSVAKTKQEASNTVINQKYIKTVIVC